MATVTKPIALDESFNTTESTPRNIADVLAEGLSGANDLSDLDDVSINTSTLANGQALVYNQSTDTWVNSSTTVKQVELTKAQYDALVTAGTVDPTTEYFINDVSSTQTIALNELSDTAISSLTIANGQSLVYDASIHKWVNGEGAGKVWSGTQAQYNAITTKDPDTTYYITDGGSVTCNLGDLDDVTITSASNGQTLQKTASGWQNAFVLTRQYYTGSTSAYGNIALGTEFDSSKKVIVMATARNKTNTNTVYLVNVYQNDVNHFGETYGLNVRDVANNNAVASTAIEGYLWLADFGT